MKSYELNPYSIILLNNLAVLAFINQDTTLADTLLESALRFCPDYKDALMNKENIINSTNQDEAL